MTGSGGHIDTVRFLDRLDRCFAREDMEGAGQCIVQWEKEARALGDRRGLLTVLNEAVGFYRRTGQKQEGLRAAEECLELLQETGQRDTLSGAVILTNTATTLCRFDETHRALPVYEQAAALYSRCGRTDSYEYAALLNNRAAALSASGRYDDAERDWLQAVRILDREGAHDADIAVSLVMLAHLAWDRDENVQRAEELLDRAWDCLNSPRQKRDAAYAWALQKCAPSFDFFRRPDAAQALREVAEEIYEGH